MNQAVRKIRVEDRVEDIARVRQESRKIAIGAIFGDGEPSIRMRNIGHRADRMSLLSASIRDGDEIVGFVAYLSEDGSDDDLADDVEVLKTKVRQLGGDCRLIAQRAIERPQDASVLLVRTLLDLQAQGGDRTYVPVDALDH